MFDNNFNEGKGIAGFACLFNAEICLGWDRDTCFCVSLSVVDSVVNLISSRFFLISQIQFDSQWNQ